MRNRKIDAILVNRAFPRRLRRALGRAVLAVAVAVPTLAAAPEPGGKPVMHSSGVEILPPAKADPPSTPDHLASALSRAMQESENAPDDFAYPYVEQQDQSVVVAPTNARGLARAEAIRDQAAKEFGAVDKPVVVVRDGKISRRQIDRAMDELIGRQAEGITVLDAYPDPPRGRLVIEVSALNDSFLRRAAATHGAAALAARLSPDANVPRYPASREADYSPFWGGANVNGCTSGFSWHSGSVEMMLTAGHCFPNGGPASTPTSYMGTVTANSEESWRSGTGTVLMTGEATYRGDLALIRIPSAKGSASSVYRGGYNSTTSGAVSGKWSRSPTSGDQYCTGGRVSGEVCGWRVVWSAAGNYYYSGTGETARRVWRGEKKGWCIAGGDSGGPVYTVNSSGSVAAKGIISGVTGYGGDDHFAGLFDASCVNVFTDIWDAYDSMPGDIN